MARLHVLPEEVLLRGAAGEPYRLEPSAPTARLLLSSGGTGNVLRRLAGARLIDREPDPDDARSSRVTLTGTGAPTSLAPRCRPVARAQADRLRPVSEADLGAAASALRDVLLALGDAVPEPALTRRRSPAATSPTPGPG